MGDPQTSLVGEGAIQATPHFMVTRCVINKDTYF